jgi:divalent anion:Na+ symporter, DASS family
VSTEAEKAKGIQIVRLMATVLVAVIIWFAPIPTGIDPRAWHLFAIFVGMILGLILQPLPMGAVVLISVITSALTETLSIGEALNGFANPTAWLIFVAFLFARAFAKTGLGRRIAYVFIRLFGHKTLGLGYALVISDLALAPGIPSGAARTGGVLYPIVRSLAGAFRSEPGPTAGKIGRFLHLNSYQAHGVTCAMFMTSMAANPLIAQLAQKTANVHISWGGWAIAALVPGLVSLATMTYLIYKIDRPEITETPEATKLAQEELQKMGAMSRDEWVVLATFVLVLLLWVTGSFTHMDATVVALFGLGLMILLGTITLCAAAVRGAAVRLLLESVRKPDALCRRPGAHLLRQRLCRPGALVGPRLRHRSLQHRYLDGDRRRLLETARPVLMPAGLRGRAATGAGFYQAAGADPSLDAQRACAR